MPKWAKTHEKLKKRACGTVKIDDLTANATVRFTNAPENAQKRRNTRLHGKYRMSKTLIALSCFLWASGASAQTWLDRAEVDGFRAMGYVSSDPGL